MRGFLGRAKGLVLSNFIYLLMFYVIYFPLMAMGLYMHDTICGLTFFSSYCSQIPASTTTMMNFMMFVVVPLGALLFTIMASRPATQQPVSY